MAVSDDDGTAERLAQVRAERRHVRRLRVGQQRDAAMSREHEANGEQAAQHAGLADLVPSLRSGDSQEFLAVEQDLLALERGSLAADGEVDGGIEFDL